MHCGDVHPVLRAIEQRLENHEILRGKERQPMGTEWLQLGTIRCRVVERRRPEEQIDRRSSPPESNLLVLVHSFDVDLGPRHPVG